MVDTLGPTIGGFTLPQLPSAKMYPAMSDSWNLSKTMRETSMVFAEFGIPMNTRTAMCVFLLSCSAMVISGCTRNPANKESGPSAKDPPGMQFLKERQSTDPCFERLRQLALARWQNGTLDPEPILLFVQLSRPVGYESVRIGLLIFDEDKDVLGFGVRERYVDANGLRSERLEEYPLFIHEIWQDVLKARSIPVQVRDKGQQKDSQAWEAYVRGQGIDKDRAMKSESYYIDTLPPIWISAPDPNRVDVYVYLYDREDHKSEAVRVLNRLARH
jgi:hypothetical protein